MQSSIKIAITSLLSLTIMFSACKKDDEKETAENKKAAWIENAFLSLESGKYPRVKAISWWHEDFDNSLLKVNSSPESLKAYQKGVSSSTFISVRKNLWNRHREFIIPPFLTLVGRKTLLLQKESVILNRLWERRLYGHIFQTTGTTASGFRQRN